MEAPLSPSKLILDVLADVWKHMQPLIEFCKANAAEPISNEPDPSAVNEIRR